MKKYLFIFLLVLISCGSAEKISQKKPEHSPKIVYHKIDKDSLNNFFSRYKQVINYDDSIYSVLYQGLYVFDNKKFPARYYHHKGKEIWFEVNINGEKIYPYIFRQEKKLKWNGKNYEELNPEEEKVFLPVLPVFWNELPVYLYSKGYAFRKVSIINQYDGIPVEVLAVLTPRALWHFYFDRKYRFLIRTEKRNLKGQIQMSIDFMDFRPSGKMDLARYWIVKNQNNEKPTKLIWKEIKINYIENLKF